MAAATQRPPSPINVNMGTLVESYASVAQMLDAAAPMPGVKGIMPTFDDLIADIDALTRAERPTGRRR